MICKISRGDEPKRLMNYLFRPSCFAKVYDRTGKRPEEYAAMFNKHNAYKPNIKLPIYHLAIRLEQHIKPTDEEFHQLGLDVLNKMGLGTDRPFVIVKHSNEKGQPGEHIHIVTSRIDYNGKVWYGRGDAKLAVALSRELGKPERFMYKDETVKPRIWNQGPNGRPDYSHADTQKINRTGEWMPKEQVTMAITLALRSVPRKGQEPLNAEFIAACEEHGVTPKIITRANGRKGLVYEFEGQDYASSKLGRAYTIGGLKKHFNSREEGYQPIDLPEERSRAFKKTVSNKCEACKKKTPAEPQLIPDENIYKMTKLLANCEYEDLQNVGEVIQMQLDFRIFDRAAMQYTTVFVKLHLGVLEERRQQKRALEIMRPDLVTVRADEVDKSDEFYHKAIYPRIVKHATAPELVQLERRKELNEKNRQMPYIRHIRIRNKMEKAHHFALDATDSIIEMEKLKKREAEFSKFSNLRKLLTKKHRGPDPALPEMKTYLAEKEEHEDSKDREHGEQRKETIIGKFNEIAAFERSRGIEIDYHEIRRQERRALELERAQEAIRKEEERKQAEVFNTDTTLPMVPTTPAKTLPAPEVSKKPIRVKVPRTKKGGVER